MMVHDANVLLHSKASKRVEQHIYRADGDRMETLEAALLSSAAVKAAQQCSVVGDCCMWCVCAPCASMSVWRRRLRL